MNIKIKTKDLLNALRQIATIVSKRSFNIIPVLKTVKLQASSDKLHLTTVDEDVSIRAEVKINATVSSAFGTACVNARLLQKLITKIPDQEISLELAGSPCLLCITAGEKCLELSTLDDFPTEIEAAPINTFIIKRDKLIKVLNNTLGTISLDDTRKGLHGICVENNKQETTFTSTNGKCLVNETVETAGEGKGEFILPYDAIKLILKMFKKGDKNVVFDLLENTRIRISNNESCIMCKAIVANYPNYRQVFPKNSKHKVSVPLKEFKQNIELIISMLDSGSFFQLEVYDNKLSFSTERNDSRVLIKFNSFISVEYQDEPVKMCFSPQLFIQAIKNLKAEKINLHFSDKYCPSKVTDDNGFIFIIMPARDR
jgi:DNA polymerase-3 subunit beta